MIYFEERKMKCEDACIKCSEECINFEKEHRKKDDKMGILRLVKVCSEKCKALIADECSAINLLIDCAKACDDLLNECGNHEAKYCLAIDENCRQCRDYCNALKNATLWIIIKARNQSE
jgi:hypothetical protein